eukprot:5393294-Pyramimonas_sp.AAC.1
MHVHPCVNRSAKRSFDHRPPSSALRCFFAVHLQALTLMKSMFRKRAVWRAAGPIVRFPTFVCIAVQVWQGLFGRPG